MTPEAAKTYMQSLMGAMVERKASDLFISANFPPSVKVDGKLTPLTSKLLDAGQAKDIAESLMSEEQKLEFQKEKELNFAIAPEGIGRFRVNVFVQQDCYSVVIRTITTVIPSFDSLNLPATLKDVVMAKRGLVIMVGATGSGKSTSLAAMIDYRNENSQGHIITIEDPVEFVHTSKKCLISHREVGRDTNSWGVALKNTLRQAPDVILIGEIRDRETMDYAIAFAETGHLCMATLHANNSNQAIDRVINFFPEERKHQLLMDLSLNLRGFISQRLVPKKGGGRAAAIEILLNSPLISDMIMKGDIHSVKEIMSKSRDLGMQTFDQALFDLVRAGTISEEDATRNADSANELRLMLKLKEGGAGLNSTSSLSLQNH